MSGFGRTVEHVYVAISSGRQIDAATLFHG